jgi:aminoglycoside/choline kinase family phosphotransferase
VQIGSYLQKFDIRVPKVFMVNMDSKLLMLEDFGSMPIKQLILNATSKAEVTNIYKTLIDCLIKIQQVPVSGGIFRQYTDKVLLEELEVFLSYYLAYKNITVDASSLEEFRTIWQGLLANINNQESVLVHRDFHAENLLAINFGSGANFFEKNIGIIDFQDAVFGPAAYDVVSLLQDARIKVDFDLAEVIIDYYLNQMNIDYNSFISCYNILGLQRNTRILGVFARKMLKDNDGRYLKFLPLILDYMHYSCRRPELTEIAKFYRKIGVFE